MTVEVPDTKQCPLNGFAECKPECALRMKMFDKEGKPTAEECAFQRLGLLSDNVATLAGIIHAHFHVGDNRTQRRQNDRKRKKK